MQLFTVKRDRTTPTLQSNAQQTKKAYHKQRYNYIAQRENVIKLN